jgi:hypothetical protein
MRRLVLSDRKSGPYTEFKDPETGEEFFIHDIELATLDVCQGPPPPKRVSIETQGGRVVRGLLRGSHA